MIEGEKEILEYSREVIYQSLGMLSWAPNCNFNVGITPRVTSDLSNCEHTLQNVLLWSLARIPHG